MITTISLHTLYTHPSFPTPMASKLLPLLVLLSCRTGTASKLISFSDGGGDPSTHPFHPFFTATRFFRFGLIVNVVGRRPRSSSSFGVRGLLDDVRDVLDELDGPGVDAADAIAAGDNGIGGGVTE
jgi:hypothetical protein